MSHSQGSYDRILSAERVLEEFFLRRDEGESIDLESLVRAHPHLEAELREMHAAASEVDGVLENGRAAHAAELGRVGAILSQIEIGVDTHTRYSVEGEIGKGGMGVVYRVRDTKLDRPLAMKVILGQADVIRTGKTPPILARQLARFVNEAKITGQLDHPGIVPVHEVGVDAEGRAFFTMKLVKGMTLTEVFERRAANDPEWSMSRVLGVIQRVCEAMAFAHERGVIHRDLKPANIMVGNFGEVYVMDWGLARKLVETDGARDEQVVEVANAVIDEQLSESLTLTRDGAVIGTPAYMSPEQARGEIAAMGPQSDVYAIGAMLYQLIAGTPPYVSKGEKASGSEVLARVVSGEPQRLESKSTPAELIAICEKAMRYEPSQRYGTVLELRDDLQRFLSGRTVTAFRTGAWMELSKWVQRNKALAGALTAVLLVSTLGGIAFALKADQATQAADRADAHAQAEREARQEAQRIANEVRRQATLAEERRQEAQRTADFQSEMLSNIWPDAFGHAIIVGLRSRVEAGLIRKGKSSHSILDTIEVLDDALAGVDQASLANYVIQSEFLERAEGAIERQLQNSPSAQATLYRSLAKTARRLSASELAERVSHKAVDKIELVFGTNSAEALEARGDLAMTMRDRRRFDEALAMLVEARECAEATVGHEHSLTLTLLYNIGLLQADMADLEAAETTLTRVFEARSQAEGEQSRRSLLALSALGGLAERRDRLEDAERLRRRATEMFGSRFGDDDDDYMMVAGGLASVLNRQGKYDESASILSGIVSNSERRYGRDHPRTLGHINNLAVSLRGQGNLAESERLTREAAQVRRLKLGDFHPLTILSEGNLASILQDLERFEEAEIATRVALHSAQARFGEDSRDALFLTHTLIELLTKVGRLPEAEHLARDCTERAGRVLGPDSIDYQYHANSLAGLLSMRGAMNEAASIHRSVLNARRRLLRPGHPDTKITMRNLAPVLCRLQLWQEAELLLSELLDLFRTGVPCSAAEWSEVNLQLALVLNRTGRSCMAVDTLRTALAEPPMTWTSADQTVNVRKRLATILENEGQLDDALGELETIARSLKEGGRGGGIREEELVEWAARLRARVAR